MSVSLLQEAWTTNILRPCVCVYKGYILIKKYLHSHDSNSHRSLSDTHMQQHTYNSYILYVYMYGVVVVLIKAEKQQMRCLVAPNPE